MPCIVITTTITTNYWISHTAQPISLHSGVPSEYLYGQLSNALYKHADNKWQPEGVNLFSEVRLHVAVPGGLSIPEILCNSLLAVLYYSTPSLSGNSHSSLFSMDLRSKAIVFHVFT